MRASDQVSWDIADDDSAPGDMPTGRGMLPAIRAMRAFADGEAPPAVDSWARNETALVVDWTMREGHVWSYDFTRRAWFTFDGYGWRQDRDGGALRSMQAYVEYRLQEAVSLERKADREPLMTFLTRMLRASQLPRLLELASHQFAIASTGDQWDAQPFLLGCQNGTLDLQTFTFRDSDRADFLTKRTAVAFDAGAAAPRWRQFIHEICSGDRDVATWLQRYMGYALTGCTDEQCFPVGHGHGANGKSTFLSTICRVLPDHAWTMAFPTSSWSESLSEYQRASLVGCRLVVAQETESGKRLHVEFIKSLTGGDLVNARFPYGKPFSFRPQAKLFLACNHRPVIRDDGHGMWRRIRLVPFEATFPVNPRFASTLLEELPGILTWLVEGCYDWQREGLGIPSAVAKATAEYRRESDHVNTFLEECCVVLESATARAQALYDAYRGWCDTAAVSTVERLTQKAFGQRIRRDFEAVEGRQTTFRGVGLRD